VLAAQIGIDLSDEHWKVIRFCARTLVGGVDEFDVNIAILNNDTGKPWPSLG
jgi:sulfur relay (sulfurtransferase) DsrC/TusE family protein